MPLTIHGPGTAGPHRVRREILKGGTYKNWRLNGEFIIDPPDEPGRFAVLEADDLAVMEFEGGIEPKAVTMLLIAAAVDPALHARLSRLVGAGRASMDRIDARPLREAADDPAVALPADHPLRFLLERGDIEDAAARGATLPQPRGRRRRLSKEELRRRRVGMEDRGDRGEELVRDHLTRLQAAGNIRGFQWEAEIDALAPYDFEVTDAAGAMVRLDVKTTNGGPDRPFHVSLPELEVMADASVRYDIYRVHGLDEEAGTGTLRIAENTAALAARLLAVLGTLPDGATADSVSIRPDADGLTFGEPVPLVADEPDGDEPDADGGDPAADGAG